MRHWPWEYRIMMGIVFVAVAWGVTQVLTAGH
jgi:hypothetical protein